MELCLAEKKAAGEAVDMPSEFFFSTVSTSRHSALQSAVRSSLPGSSEPVLW